MRKAPPLGTGQRFKALEAALAAKGARNPAGLASSLGRKKYSKARFQQMATKGRARA